MALPVASVMGPYMYSTLISWVNDRLTELRWYYSALLECKVCLGRTQSCQIHLHDENKVALSIGMPKPGVPLPSSWAVPCCLRHNNILHYYGNRYVRVIIVHVALFDQLICVSNCLSRKLCKPFKCRMLCCFIYIWDVFSAFPYPLSPDPPNNAKIWILVGLSAGLTGRHAMKGI